MQKFVITSDGTFKYGDVRMHRDLLDAGDVCIGGGRYEFDYIMGSLLLSGSSYDYGAPQWRRIDTLKLPLPLQGLTVRYEGEDVSQFLRVEFA